MWLKNEFIKLIFVKTTYLKAKLPLKDFQKPVKEYYIRSEFVHTLNQ